MSLRRKLVPMRSLAARKRASSSACGCGVVVPFVVAVSSSVVGGAEMEKSLLRSETREERVWVGFWELVCPQLSNSGGLDRSQRPRDKDTLGQSGLEGLLTMPESLKRFVREAVSEGG